MLRRITNVVNVGKRVIDTLPGAIDYIFPLIRVALGETGVQQVQGLASPAFDAGGQLDAGHLDGAAAKNSRPRHDAAHRGTQLIFGCRKAGPHRVSGFTAFRRILDATLIKDALGGEYVYDMGLKAIGILLGDNYVDNWVLLPKL